MNSVWKRAPRVRRAWVLWCALALAACGGELDGLEGLEQGELSVPQEALATQEYGLSQLAVRVAAANTTSGNNQSYDPGHGLRIFQGTDPDVVLIQEFSYGDNSSSAIRQMVDSTFGTGFSYYREGGAQIPNGIISRWPILAAGEWDDPYVSNRDFAWARIDLPGTTKDLWVVSVHLLTSDATTRNNESIELVQRINANVPAGDYLVVGGDLNTGSRNESSFSTLSQVVVTSGPHPVDQNGNGNTNASRAKPYDHVLVDGDLRQYQTATVIGGSTYSAGLVVDTRVYSPLSEISPALSADSGSTNMQHMQVVKDFLIPADGTTPTASVTVGSPNGGESWAGGSAQSITWTSSGVSNVRLEYTLDGSTWSTIVSSTAASAGSYAWTVPSSATTAARVRVSDAANTSLSDVSNATFTITVSGGGDGGGGSGLVFINEILANEPGSDTSKEFVELLNSGTAAVDLSGWTVSDAAGRRHTFASGTSLAAGAAVAVFGGAAGIPSGLTNAVAASTGSLGLSNSGDTVTLRDASGATVSSFTYPSSLSGTDAVSMNRSPDGSSSGTFQLHTSLSSQQSSPGKRADGTDFSGGGDSGGGDGGGDTLDPSITSESESNDTSASADGRVAAGLNVSGAISTSTDVDWFYVDVTASGTVTVSLTMAGGADLDWYLYAESNTSTYLARGYTTSNPETGSYSISSPGRYFVKVVGYSGATDSYTLKVSGSGVAP